ncbi:ATP synthase subunit O, mitochondrial-like [Carlito syrichta]|uniref:ATP synthase peripheral stalk subunit OSCP, mitochondrial n=1 Tax=Carlito syrichta TaxID=1868482 RepID=A0A1U7V264_CARSF|nr:ATP synthase subunit O, mitochondrial-like [Carlito syrichta]
MAGPAMSGLFSTSVVRLFAKLVRPAVQVCGIEGHCTTALCSVASRQNKLKQVEKKLSRAAQLLKEPKVTASILNPYVKCSIRVKSLSDITAKQRFSPLTSNLINLLAESGYLGNTQGVISAFPTMMSVRYGEVPCTVITASPLEEATLTELKTVLKSFISQGQILKLEVKTDPSIMGGMIVHLGEKYVDMSAKIKIQKLTRTMWEII